MRLTEKQIVNDLSPYLNQIIDFRNGRYQGKADIYSRRPYGKGMFLDENYLFVLSDWVNGIATGKTFAVFPDNHIFYGNLYDGRTNKLCAYKQPGKFTIYLKQFINQSNLAIIDDYVSQSLLVLYVNYKQWTKLSDLERENKAAFVAAESSKNKFINVVEHKVYLNEQQKWKIIEQYAKENVDAQYRNYSSFINSAFSVSQTSTLISYQDANQYELSYQGSSIVCKINKSEKIEEDYDVKLIGIYDEGEQIFEAYKNVKAKDKFEQFVKGSPAVTYSQRPKQCLKKMREFYKKSTTFYNSCIKVTHFYQINSFFLALSQYIDYFLTNKYAQTFLYQNSNTLHYQADSSSLKKIDPVHLKDIQRQIERSVLKKSSPERRRIKNYCESLYENEQGIYARIKKYSKQKDKNYLQDYVWMIQNTPQQKINSRREPLAIIENRQRENQVETNTIGKVSKISNKQSIKQPPQVILPLRKLQPLKQITIQFEHNSIRHPRVKQNLAQLTQDLANIQNQLKKQNSNTPKKYSKVSNNSANRSPYGKQAPSPKASTKRSDLSKLTQKSAHTNSSSPFHTRKSGTRAGWR